MSLAFVETPSPIDRTPRFRARRINVDVAKLGPVRASFEHAELGELTVDVLDLTVHGLALELPLGGTLALLVGDRLNRLEATCLDQVLFRGSGTVRRIAEEADKLVIGVELEGDGLDLAELRRHEARLSFAQRLQNFEGKVRDDRISPAFKAWVADVQSYLLLMRDFLSEEERNLADEDKLTREETFQQYLSELAPRFIQEAVKARDDLSSLVSELSEEEHAVHRAYFRLHVLPLLRESPLLRRSFDKPLGYAGDFEMMNMLYRDHAEGDSLFGKVLNIYAAREHAAQANINRIAYLGNRIRAEVAAKPHGRVRIASIGCGPSHEIAELLKVSPELGARLDVALVDQEERSIAYCERTLAPLVRSTGVRIQFVRESVRRLLTTRRLGEALGERELIYSAGLFDYLSDRTFGALLTSLYGALAENGKVLIGNVAAHNPSRWMMEYYCDWFLIHRTPDQLRAYADALSPAASSIEVDAEPTGVNLFLIVKR